VMVSRSDRDPQSLNDVPSFELSGEMRRGSAKSIRARRLRPAKQAGYKPAASSVGHHTEEPLHIGRRPYKNIMKTYRIGRGENVDILIDESSWRTRRSDPYKGRPVSLDRRQSANGTFRCEGGTGSSDGCRWSKASLEVDIINPASGSSALLVFAAPQGEVESSTAT